MPVAQITAFAGGVVIVIGVNTVITIAALVAAGVHVPVITQRYWLLFIATVTPVSVKIFVVAPLYIPPLMIPFHVPPPFVLSCHWYVNPTPLATTL